MRIATIIAFAITLLFAGWSYKMYNATKEVLDTETVSGTIQKITYGEYTIRYHLKEYPNVYFVSSVSDGYLQDSEVLTGLNPWALNVLCTIEYLKSEEGEDDPSKHIINFWRENKPLIMEEAFREARRGSSKNLLIIAFIFLFITLAFAGIVVYEVVVLSKIRKKISSALSLNSERVGDRLGRKLKVDFQSVRGDYTNSLKVIVTGFRKSKPSNTKLTNKKKRKSPQHNAEYELLEKVYGVVQAFNIDVFLQELEKGLRKHA